MGQQIVENSTPNAQLAGGEDFREKLIELIPFLRAFEVVMRPAYDHLTTVFEKVNEQVFQGQDTRLIIH